MIIDITQELFSCNVFPGDPKPECKRVMSIEEGAQCNLTSFSMCAHNGTHVDAPFHFVRDGKTIDEVGIEPFVGPCYVARHEGNVSEEDAAAIHKRARQAGAAGRILIAGKATVTEPAARVFAAEGVRLVGNESQTVGAGCVLLEGIVLSGVEEGTYTLHAAPLNLGGCDGAPCRAYLIKD